MQTSLTICQNCGNCNERDEDYYSLQLQVKDKKSIDDSLKSFVAGERISDYKCTACNQTVEIEKKSAIKSLPNYLLINLNRIVFDYDLMRHVKIDDRFEFPNQLNLQDYMLDTVKSQIKKPEEEDSKNDTEMLEPQE